MKPIVVVGTGPHSEMCAAVIASTGAWDVVGHVGADPSDRGPDDMVITGCDDDLLMLVSDVGAAFVGIGESTIRERLTSTLSALGFDLPAIVAPSAIVAHRVDIAPGVLVAPGAIINTRSTIGTGTIINTGAVVEHHVTVESFAHIAPNSTLCGNVSVGRGALVGAGAVVLPGVRVGSNAIVAAGAAAPRDIAPHTVVGLPARSPK